MRLQPLLKSAQASIVPAPRLAYNYEQEDNDSYTNGMEAQVYDEAGNDLMAEPSHLVPDNTQNVSELAFYHEDINDNCTALGLSIYADYGIANVALSEHWRVYPNDDNLQALKSMISEDNLHFHYS